MARGFRATLDDAGCFVEDGIIVLIVQVNYSKHRYIHVVGVISTYLKFLMGLVPIALYGQNDKY